MPPKGPSEADSVYEPQMNQIRTRNEPRVQKYCN